MATVLVIGANRGIGLEFVRQFLERGDKVLATCRNKGKAGGLQKLQAGKGNLEVFEVDVQHEQSIASLATDLKKTLGGEGIDLLIHNAGVYGPRGGAVEDLDGDAWAEVLRVNSIAPLLVTRYLLDLLRAGKTAKAERKLVYITSKMGSMGDNEGGGSYIYRSSKAALNAAAKSLAIDLAGENILVGLLHPGWVQTDMGGPSALIDTRTSVNGMLKLIDGLSPKTSGKFQAYDGKAIPW